MHFRLTDATAAAECFAAINGMVGTGKVVTVSVIDHRSYEQNRLYWRYIAIIADALGNTKEYQHTYLKRHLLAKIYARDDEGFAAMADSLKQCRQHLGVDKYEQLATAVSEHISTTTATVAQFAEYLSDIEQWAADKGIL